VDEEILIVDLEDENMENVKENEGEEEEEWEQNLHDNEDKIELSNEKNVTFKSPQMKISQQ
jgi:hypothetical protein